MPGTARRLRITCGVADSPIRNATSVVPAISALAASSPPISCSCVGGPSISLILSSFNASTRVPLPSGPTAIRLPLSCDSISMGSSLRQYAMIGCANTLPSDTRPVVSMPSDSPPCTKPTSTMDLPVGELLQVVERAFRRQHLHLHAVALR